MISQLRTAVLVFVALTVITGVAYPVAMTLIAQGLFPFQANGSLLERNGKVVGSELIGQQFVGQRYFWGRPSATSPMPYNAAASAGSNFGPTNPAQLEAVRQRVAAIRIAHKYSTVPIPIDLVTASASGLDSHISPAAAEFQMARVAESRGMDPDTVRAIVEQHTEARQLGILGEPRVNVLMLNLTLDGLPH